MPRKPQQPSPALRRAFQIPMARSLARRYGHAAAARYLRKRGWSIEAALFILLSDTSPLNLGPRAERGEDSDKRQPPAILARGSF